MNVHATTMYQITRTPISQLVGRVPGYRLVSVVVIDCILPMYSYFKMSFTTQLI